MCTRRARSGLKREKVYPRHRVMREKKWIIPAKYEVNREGLNLLILVWTGLKFTPRHQSTNSHTYTPHTATPNQLLVCSLTSLAWRAFANLHKIDEF
ncbi:hypothetical protein Pmani_011880 [Petrolisthes manimaculis]|uniref:Uncharacterized protein n=1 Tax=Petrolisthes manimaculis TaxID=1843537 RepID=A0AAE1PYU0_9EUCA|nr:hypothetical protein Pmani_011880 [Petrolisthes manimaculis]